MSRVDGGRLRRLPPVGGRAVAVDALPIAVISVAICAWADRIGLMTACVAVLFLVRTIAWSRLSPEERGGGGLGAELLFLVLCTALGAYNDWNTVDQRHVYSYTVPSDLAPASTIPLWMLLYWGLILRFVATLTRWRWLGTGGARPPDSRDRRPMEALRLPIELCLVLLTRSTIYAHHSDPWLSWLPFAGGLAIFLVLFPPDRGERRLLALALVAGPLVESLYIRVGGLHHYELGWLGGVPLWIALWWGLAVLVWGDLSEGISALLQAATRSTSGRPGSGATHPVDQASVHSS